MTRRLVDRSIDRLPGANLISRWNRNERYVSFFVFNFRLARRLAARVLRENCGLNLR